MEKAKQCLGEMVDMAADLLALTLRLLPVEEYKQKVKGDDLEADTVYVTIKKQQELLNALYGSKNR